MASFWVDATINYLNEVIKSDMDLAPAVKDDTEKLGQELSFLRCFVKSTAIVHTESERSKDLLKRIRDETKSAIYWFRYFLNDNTSFAKVKIEKNVSDLLKFIVNMKPEVREIYAHVSKKLQPNFTPSKTQDLVLVISFMDSLIENLNKLATSANFFLLVQELSQVLSFVRSFLRDDRKQVCTETEKLEHLLTRTEFGANKLGIFIYLAYLEGIDESKAEEMNHVLVDFREIKKLIVAEEGVTICSTPVTDPKALIGFMDSLMDNMNNGHLLAAKKDRVEAVKSELIFFQSFLRNITDQPTLEEELHHFAGRIGDIVHEIEYVIDEFMVHDFSIDYFSWRISHIMEEIKHIKAGITRSFGNNMNEIGVCHRLDKIFVTTKPSPQAPATANAQPSQADSSKLVVVGFEDEATRMKGRLTATLPRQLEVICVVGMPGLGKTTLTRKVYDDPLTVEHFYVRAWCCVSQVYQKKDLLLDILSSVIELTDLICKMSDQNLAEKLYRSLKEKRFLLVMDDMWNLGAWDDLKRCFPNDNNGSKIVFTSRLKLQVKSESVPFHLRFLTKEESWKLLQMKLFQNKNCPSKLQDVGQDIAAKCQGLPLSIVVVAGLLMKTETEDWWKKIAKNLSSHVVRDSKQCTDALELSYKHLPSHLKSCFMYCGVFPEDKEIPVWRLMLLWIAEGFIETNGHKSLEDAAEDCLINLVGRSLILVSKRGSNGKIKTCKMHDLLRDLSLRKAKEENFQQHIHGYDSSSRHSTYQQRRLCITRLSEFVDTRIYGPQGRSLLFILDYGFFATVDLCDVSFIFQSFRLVRVLDLENFAMTEIFPFEVTLLIHLRYLALRGDWNHIFTSVSNLQNLETLIVKGCKGGVSLPTTISNMVKLRHLYVGYHAVFIELLPKPLTNLQTISKMYFPSDDWTNQDKIARNFPNLQKLGCILHTASSDWSIFPKLESLICLESLKVFYHGLERSSYQFNFPLNLKKLTLSKFRLPWKAISTVGKLPNLEVLKLLFKAFEGEEWKSNDEEFKKLKFLKLDTLDLQKWNSSNYHFSRLEQLVVQRCKKLMEIPSCFGEISTLKSVEINWCSGFAAKSVRKIHDYQLEMGYEGLSIRIHPPHWELRSFP